MAEYLPKNLANGQLPSSKTTLYTCPANKRAIIRSILLVNTDTGASKTVDMYCNFGGGSRRILPAGFTLAKGAKADDNSAITLEAGHLIEGNASAATTVDYVISGVEQN